MKKSGKFHEKAIVGAAFRRPRIEYRFAERINAFPTGFRPFRHYKTAGIRKIALFLSVVLFVVCVLGTGFTANAETAPIPIGAGGDGALLNAPEAVYDKNEVVYARLTAAGDVENIYVVNHFVIETGGVITDYGDYSRVQNLTTQDNIFNSDRQISIATNAESLYYQGDLAHTDLPFLYNIHYILDGSPISGQELAGKSGVLEIRLTSRRNAERNIAINEAFYNNYMQQITVSLDQSKTFNIEAPGAARAFAGKTALFAYTVLPGNNADIVITCDVRQFEMAGIEIAAMPFTMEFDIPHTGDLVDGFTELASAVAEIADGADELRGGAAQLTEGAAELAGGQAEFGTYLSRLARGGREITSASGEIAAALNELAAGLSAGLQGGGADAGLGAMPDISTMQELPVGLSQTAAGLVEVSRGLNALKDGYSQAFDALNAALLAIPAYDITEDSTALLFRKANEQEKMILAQLLETYAAARVARGTYEQTVAAFAQITPAIEAAADGIDKIAGGLDGAAQEIALALADFGDAAANAGGQAEIIQTQISQLAAGLATLAENYAAFDEGLSGFASGVSQLSSNFGAISSGSAEIADALILLTDGVAQLSDGTAQMATETANIPDRFQAEIETMLDDYMGADFTPVSFTSAQNAHTKSVQFVFQTAPIQIPEPPVIARPQPAEASFWDRMRSLFTMS